MSGESPINAKVPDINADEGIRVLMFCPQFAPVIGGAEQQAEKLGKTLCRAGVNVRILTPRLDKVSPRHEVRGGLSVHRFGLSDLSRRLPRLRGIGLINGPWIALQVIWRVWREARHVDLVHCHIGGLQTVAAACAARLRGLPVICKAAMADDRSDLGEMARSGKMGRIAALASKRAFTRWIATTRAVQQALQRAGVDERLIVVIPNGVELPTVAMPQRTRSVRRFLYLGRLSNNIERDVPSLIRAFDRLADEINDVELAVVGGGDLLDATRILASTCRHADRIQVPGQGAPAEWLAWADGFVLPSRREGLSNALLEAMAARLPCIANDIPPNREVLGDGDAGILVQVESVEQLRLAMFRLATDRHYASWLAGKSSERAARLYSIASVAQRYRQLYVTLSRCSGAKL